MTSEMQFTLLCLVLLTVNKAISQDGTIRVKENMCERTVSESIPTTVTRTVGVRVRSTYKCGFLWLKTCSRYHTSYRLTTAIQYIAETRTIAVCCNGTDASGSCTVPKNSCNIPGKFGVNCASTCDCETNRTTDGVCDVATGYCFCKDGYGGHRCNSLIPSSKDTDSDVSVLGNSQSEVPVAGGGDVATRAVVALVVIVLVLAMIVVVFCCWRRRKRRKGATGGATLTDDIILNILPETESPAQYVTPEEIRMRKRQEAQDEAEESVSKSYDYMEMQGLSGSRPALSDPSDKPALIMATSITSLSRKALEEAIAAGRISCAYANLPDQYSGHDPDTSHYTSHDPDTSHYYLDDADDSNGKLPFAPTYSFPRRQESKDSAFDDDGYCTSPTQSPDAEDLNIGGSEYSKPMYFVDRSANRGENEAPVENIYDLPSERIHPPETRPSTVDGDDNGYANSSVILNREDNSTSFSDIGKSHDDGYDHLDRDC